MSSAASLNTTNVMVIASNKTQETYRYIRPFDDNDIIIVATILLTLLVLGVFGNAVTIAVIARDKNLKSVFNTFLLSLCVSDLYSAIISPLHLHRRTWGFDDWAIPNFFCKFYWGSDLWTSYTTAHHVASFALLRLLSIKWPHKFSRITQKHVRIWIISLWIFSFCTGFVPFATFLTSSKRDRYSNHVTAKWPSCTCGYEWIQYCKWQAVVFHPLFFYVPCVAIVGLSIAIAIILWKRRSLNSKSTYNNKTELKNNKEKQAILQLFLIIGSFLLGYIPFTAYALYTQLVATSGNDGMRFDWMFGMSYYICMRLSECLNPLFYNLGSTKIRRSTKKLFLGCCMKETSRLNRSSLSSASTKTSRHLPDSRVRSSFDDPIIHDERAL